MSHQEQPDTDRSGGGRAKSRWWAVGVTGLALTTAGVAAAAPAANAVERTRTTVADRLFTDEHRDKRDGGKPDDKSKGDPGKTGKKSPGTPVSCDADALIAAITLSNARGGGVLDLAGNCTYLLTASIDDAGLPAISSPITLNGGEHTTIERAAAVDQFRILNVEAGGHLTLNHLTVTGGQTTDPGADGAGILVAAGGSLTTNHSTITRNIAGAGSGGGIANSGTARIRSSKVSHNTAATTGGGILNSGLLEVSKAGIHANTALNGAGVASSETVRIEHSSISKNRAQVAFGGLLIDSGTAVVADSSVTHNIATGVVGGIIASVGTQVTIRSTTIADNVSLTTISGGLGVDSNASVVVTDSIIKNNSAGTNGGGIYTISELVLRNTKIFGNQAGSQGGGIYNEPLGTLTLFASKVTKNIAATDGGGIYNEAGGTVNLNTATGTVVVKNRPNNCVDVPGCAG